MPADRLPFENALSHEALATIGLVMVTAANCEANLFSQALRFHGPKPNAAIVQSLSGQELRVRINQIRAMARMQFETSHFHTIKILCDNVENTFKKRNMLAHNMICAADDPQRILIMGTKLGGSFPQAQTWHLDQIVDIALDIHRSMIALGEGLTAAGVPHLASTPDS